MRIIGVKKKKKNRTGKLKEECFQEEKIRRSELGRTINGKYRECDFTKQRVKLRSKGRSGKRRELKKIMSEKDE